MPARHVTLYILACLLLVAPLSSQASTIVIDDFTLPNSNFDVISNTGNSWATRTTTVTGATGALGGQRTIQAESVTGGAGFDATNVISNGGTGDPDLDIFVRGDASLTYTGKGTVSWGGSTPLNQDFTTAGSPLLFILTLEDISAPTGDAPSLANITLSFATAGGGTASHTLSLLQGGSLPSQYVWQESDFGGYDFSDVDEISLDVTIGYVSPSAQSEVHVSMSSLVAVPEPGTYALLASGLCAAAVAAGHRRLRSSAQQKPASETATLFGDMAAVLRSHTSI